MSERKFNIGDRVRVIGGPGAGSTGTVVSALELTRCEGVIRYTHDLDVDGFGGVSERGFPYAAPPKWLHPIYDGNEPVSWESCEWQPKQVRA